MKLFKLAPFLIVATLAVILFLVRKNENADETAVAKRSSSASIRGLNRQPNKIVYSRHAKCRMQCRDITEAEINEVLQEGKINYRKSELQKDDCQKRYAVEDKANGQYIRIVVAQCDNILTVITCIDLDKEWSCECPG